MNQSTKKTVVIGFLGTTLDQGKRGKRWERWRPTVSVFQQQGLSIDRLELMHDRRSKKLAEKVKDDVASLSANSTINSIDMPLNNPWDLAEMYGKLYDWAKSYPFKPETEDYLVHITTGTHVAQICWFLLVESRHIPARLLQTSPGLRRTEADEKTWAKGVHEIIDLDLSRYDALAQRFDAERHDAQHFLKQGIDTRNEAFNRMIDELERVAVRSPSPILLTGPTGAGKSMLARRLYELKKAKHLISGAFVDVNCATLKGDGAASALFGHVKGAYTGALSARKGWLRSADKGMLFLDEIGELGLDEQAMLLKAIEEKRFFPVGGDTEVGSDFQLVAGTNRDLRDDVAAGRFRDDLFARINLWSYQLPGLAQRREDIEPNLLHQLTEASKELGRSVRINQDAKQAYLDFALSPQATWRGNFRDLTSSVMRMATLAEQGRVHTDVAQEEIKRLQWLWKEPSQESNAAQHLRSIMGDDAWQGLDVFDQVQLEQVWRICQQSRSMADAGRTLFNQSRLMRASKNDSDRLRKYLGKFGLSWDDVR